MEKLKMPSDADLMKVAIADLNNSSLSFEDRYRALNELLILVEPIDNANGMIGPVEDLISSAVFQFCSLSFTSILQMEIGK